jgi:dCTP deaminase
MKKTSNGGILSGPEIHEYIKSGRIQVSPFNPKHLNPASLDLTLGDEVVEYLIDGVIDVRKPPEVRRRKIGPEGFVVQAHSTYLMHTAERLCAWDTVPVIDGKSSLGRLFVSVHQTAGYLDPGFNGQATLEVTSYHSVRVYPGMRFCQVRFHPIVGQVAFYEGHYQKDMAEGAVPSMVHKQMEELESRRIEK